MMRTGLTWTRPISSARPALTLVEIMVVVAIIGILAAIGIWSAGRLSDDAKSRQTQQILDMLQNGVSAHKTEHNEYPPWPTDLDANTPATNALAPVDSQLKRADYWHQSGKNKDALPRPPYLFDGALPTILACDEDGDLFSDGNRPAIYSIQALYHALGNTQDGRSLLTRLPDEMKVGPNQPEVSPSLFVEPPVQYLGYCATGKCRDDTRADGRVQPASFILDAWKRPLYYGWNQNLNNGVPYLQSAGPDGLWGSADDLYSFARAGQ